MRLIIFKEKIWMSIIAITFAMNMWEKTARMIVWMMRQTSGNTWDHQRMNGLEMTVRNVIISARYVNSDVKVYTASYRLKGRS